MKPFKKLFKKKNQKPGPTAHQLLVEEWKKLGGDEILRLDYDLGRESVVLDLGGYKGQWASDIYARYLCNLHVFEPVDSFCEKIKARFERNPDISVYSFGLGEADRSEQIFLQDDATTMFSVEGEAEEIQIVDVKKWLDENNLSNIDLIKVNTEGGEYELLNRLISEQMTDVFKDIQVQFHDISEASRSNMEAIRAALAKTHRVTYQYDFVWENWCRK